MDTLEAIYTRRSIRKFVLKDISMDDITNILRAGMCAPTAGNQRPWQFIVIQDRTMINRIMEINPYTRQMLPDVPVTIMVCFDKSLEKYENRWQMDCANSTLNMLLAAHSLGYGGLWLEIYPVEDRIEKIQQAFGIPEAVIPFVLVAVGYADEKKSAIERYEESRIHQNRWE